MDILANNDMRYAICNIPIVDSPASGNSHLMIGTLIRDDVLSAVKASLAGKIKTIQAKGGSP
jgi:hypothetical protein